MTRALDFLKDDVRKHGGSASEVLDVHGTLLAVTVCAVPWGLLVLRREVSHLEATVFLFSAE